MKRHVPPSRIRYEQSHPVVSLRVTVEQKRKLDSIRKKAGQSRATILKEGLGLIEATVGEAYTRGYRDGWGRFETPCKKCGKPMKFDIKAEPDAKASLIEAFGTWSHTNCQAE